MTGSGITTISGREDFPVEVEDSTAAEHPETGNEQTEKTLVSLDDDFPRRTTRIRRLQHSAKIETIISRGEERHCAEIRVIIETALSFSEIMRRENTQNTST